VAVNLDCVALECAVGLVLSCYFGVRSSFSPQTQNSSLAENVRRVFVERRFMSALFKQIFRWLCPHRFSWPHTGAHGQDYQVCLICGTAFEYDLNTMRRTGRLVLPTDTLSQ
jgi:hypothetical protein